MNKQFKIAAGTCPQFLFIPWAYQERDFNLIGLKTDFLLDPLRSDPRFAELVRKVGLPQ